MFEPSRSRLAAAAVALLAVGGCGGDGPSTAAPTTAAQPPGTAPAGSEAPTTTAPAAPLHVLATAKVPRVDVYASPVQPEPARTLDNPQPSGAAPGSSYPLRMLVVEDRGDWLKVLLPVRPNGSNGWIRRNAVDLESHDYRMEVELGAHRITVWKGGEVVLQEPVGVGASGRTPTTQGTFFTTELFEVAPHQRSAYGPYAFALSGFSEVLHSFGEGGTGVLGIHGTSDSSSLGRDVSNGCIRMSNDGITKLANLLPLGVPVEIKA
ncbi:MAG TPA: L,D-transpeptidase [Acidimicrobiales bacterium]|nr:L,D-transpeptidase [Acidimicrobiales bacterium]